MLISNFPEAFAALGLISVRMAECVKITRADGTVYRFTGYTEDVLLAEAPETVNVTLAYVGANPPLSTVLGTVTLANETTFPANFADATGSVTNPPAVTPYELDVQDDGVSIGTISIDDAGVFTFTTAGGLEIIVAAGSDITFVSSAIPDGPLEDINVNLVGTFIPSFTYGRADAFDITALELSDGLAVSNMDINCIISDDSLSSGDLFAGLFDNAKVELIIATWDASGTIWQLPLRVSWMGETVTKGISFKSDLRGIAERLNSVFTQTTSLECRNVLGDSKCKVDLAPLTVTDTIAAVDSTSTKITLTTSTVGRAFRYGLVKFNDGQAAGTQMEIIKHVGDVVHLFLPPDRLITVGDSVDVIEGCSRVLDQCDLYNNTVRFNGEPFLEGKDIFGRYPNAAKE